MRILFWIFIALFVIGIAPILSMLIASGIASANGCILNEGGVHQCILLGTDWGETLNIMFVMAWLTLVTFPLALIGLAGAVVTAIIWFFRKT